MRAIVHIGKGGPEALALREVPTPAPGPGQIRVRVAASGINRANVLKRRGDDAPVVFLYSPHQLYFSAKKIKGIETENIVLPSQRFADINKWYIKTQRVKKD